MEVYFIFKVVLITGDVLSHIWIHSRNILPVGTILKNWENGKFPQCRKIIWKDLNRDHQEPA